MLETPKEKYRPAKASRLVPQLQALREIPGYGRTVGIPVLEYHDSIGFTVWDGEQRRLGQEK